jgi:hypothetical protein
MEAPLLDGDAMNRGKPLEGAPGWRVIERSQTGPRPEPRKRRVSITILAIAAGLFLACAVTYRYQVGWPEGHQPQFAAPAATAAPRASALPATGIPVAVAPAPEPAIAAGPAAETRIAKGQPEVAAAARLRSPPPPDSLRIVIHYPAHHDDAVPAIRLAALLQTRGFAVVDIRLVEVEIEQPSVRYFFPGDRADSRRLVDVIDTLVPHQAPDKATDFSHFSPKPRPGTVELWLPAAGPGPLAQDSSS